MWPFSKKNKNNADLPAAKGQVDVSHLSPQKQKLMAQMREIRAEIGEEELQKMASALQHENLKKQIRHDIENDDQKRQRLIDEIRFGLRNDD